MHQNQTSARASPTPTVVPVEVEQLIFRLYPEASTRHSILKGINDQVARMHLQGRNAEISGYIQQEIDAMMVEEKERKKGKRRKLFTIVGKVSLAALAVASHWHW